MTIRDASIYIRVLLYSYYTIITGWGVHLNYSYYCSSCLLIVRTTILTIMALRGRFWLRFVRAMESRVEGVGV